MLQKNYKEIGTIGDGNIVGRMNKHSFNEKKNGREYINIFRGATINCLKYFIQSTLHKDNPNDILIHIGCNDIVNFTSNVMVSIKWMFMIL